MKKQRLVFVPIAAEPFANTVRQVLEELGFVVHTSQLIDNLVRAQDKARQILVMLFSQREFSRDRVLSYLKSDFVPPSLAVFLGSDRAIDDDIARHCDEFVCWPCGKRELSTRLQFLSESLPASETETGLEDQPVLEEFLRHNLVGRSSAFLKVLRRIKKIASCDAAVLIGGETGTGKELAARAIHYLGERKNFPFIPVNCGAIPDSLIENELFGHESGAYTDAKVAGDGLIARAEGGTLFLDEIDSLSAKAQVVLLRFLQDLRFLPLGGRHLRDADVRVIAASNRSVSDLVKKGDFRQDLFFRLNLMSLEMPPLRERRDDVVLLAKRFIFTFRQQYQQPSKKLHASMIQFIKSHEWPGNVRELENFLHREFLLADSDEIVAPAGPVMHCNRRLGSLDRRQSYTADLGFGEAKAKLLKEFERQYLRSLLEKTVGNVSRAAKLAGKERRAFGRLLKKHGIRREEFAS